MYGLATLHVLQTDEPSCQRLNSLPKIGWFSSNWD